MKTDWKNRFAIHILTRERHNYLSCLLHSLFTQTHTNWDLFILDNNDEHMTIQKNHLIMTILHKIQVNKHVVNILRPTQADIKKNIGLSRNLLTEASAKDYKWAVRIDDDSILDMDYLLKLWLTIQMNPTQKVGAVGGVVPAYGNTDMYKYPPKIFNQIKKDNVPEKYLELSGKFPELGGFTENEEYYNIGEPVDDGGYLYHPDYPHIIPSHHLRSSYLFSIPALLGVGGFPSSDDTGFREETVASIKLIDRGFKLYTNTQAVAWHLWAPNLGRGYTQEYTIAHHEKKILQNEINFQRKHRLLLRKLFDK